MNSIVLLDIDGTLFNPELFGRLIRQEFMKILGVSEEDLTRTIADYYANLETTSDFNPHNITVFIAKKYGAESASLDRVFWENEKIYRDSLYPEVVNVLKQLSKDKTLGVYSQGNDELQRHKLKTCDLIKYFNEKYFFIQRLKGSDEVVAALPRDATVIDDNHDLVKKISPYVEAIWINRRTEEKDPQVSTIHNLNELITNN